VYGVLNIKAENLNEQELVNRARDGDDAAFAGLVEIYWSPIYRYLLRLAGDVQGAEDLTQETFFKAYRGLGKMQGQLQFRPWLYKIATNLAISHARRKKWWGWLSLDRLKAAEIEPDADLPDAAPSPADLTLQDETSRAVAETLRKLPPEQTALLLLRFYHDLEIDEIGQILGLNENAVRARLHRARLAFRRQFEQIENKEL
jgi:RNA polymerase sigma-70 factor, ECF subfamily